MIHTHGCFSQHTRKVTAPCPSCKGNIEIETPYRLSRGSAVDLVNCPHCQERTIIFVSEVLI